MKPRVRRSIGVVLLVFVVGLTACSDDLDEALDFVEYIGAASSASWGDRIVLDAGPGVHSCTLRIRPIEAQFVFPEVNLEDTSKHLS
jgi:hypothetical protein